MVHSQIMVATLSAIVLCFAFARAGDSHTSGAEDEPAKVPSRGDLKAIQGEWECERATLNGIDVKVGDDPRAFLFHPNIVGDGWTGGGNQEGGRKVLARIALRDHGKRKEIDLIDPANGERSPGLYHLDGDRLTICINLESGAEARPEGFDSLPSEKKGLFIYDRKPKDPAPRPARDEANVQMSGITRFTPQEMAQLTDAELKDEIADVNMLIQADARLASSFAKLASSISAARDAPVSYDLGLFTVSSLASQGVGDTIDQAVRPIDLTSKQANKWSVRYSNRAGQGRAYLEQLRGQIRANTPKAID